MYKYKNKLTVKKGMKRFVARRSRVIRNNMDVDGGMIKCEAYDQITINSGATSPIFFQSTNTFVNLLTMLANSEIGKSTRLNSSHEIPSRMPSSA